MVRRQDPMVMQCSRPRSSRAEIGWRTTVVVAWGESVRIHATGWIRFSYPVVNGDPATGLSRCRDGQSGLTIRYAEDLLRPAESLQQAG